MLVHLTVRAVGGARARVRVRSPRRCWVGAAPFFLRYKVLKRCIKDICLEATGGDAVVKEEEQQQQSSSSSGGSRFDS